MSDLPRCQAVGFEQRDYSMPVSVRTRCGHQAVGLVTVYPEREYARRWSLPRDARQIAVCSQHRDQLLSGGIVARIIGEQKVWPNAPITEDVALNL